MKVLMTEYLRIDLRYRELGMSCLRSCDQFGTWKLQRRIAGL